MKESQVDVPALIKKIRRITGRTQVEMAEGLGITPTSIHRYEAGASKPSVGILRDLLTFASKRRELVAERELLEQLLDERTGESKQFRADMDALFRAKRHSLSPLRRPLMDVNILASLAPSEHSVLEAALAVMRGKDDAAKRMLWALLKPWLPASDAPINQPESKK